MTRMDDREKWEEIKETFSGVRELRLPKKASFIMREDPRGLLHILARYKFALKMMTNRKNLNVLELGCNDGIGTRMLWKDAHCSRLVGIDFDEEAVAWAKANLSEDGLDFICGDFLGKVIYPRGGGRCSFFRCHRAYPVGKRGCLFQNRMREFARRWIHHHRHTESCHAALCQPLVKEGSYQQL